MELTAPPEGRSSGLSQCAWFASGLRLYGSRTHLKRLTVHVKGLRKHHFIRAPVCDNVTDTVPRGERVSACQRSAPRDHEAHFKVNDARL
jgi:hypothetical protein